MKILIPAEYVSIEIKKFHMMSPCPSLRYANSYNNLLSSFNQFGVTSFRKFSADVSNKAHILKDGINI